MTREARSSTIFAVMTLASVCLLVRILGDEVIRVASAADSVHLVSVRALLGAHLEPVVDGVLHVCRDSDVSLDEALCLVKLGTF